MRNGLDLEMHANKRTRTSVDASLANITNSCALDHVPHSESLDGFVFADTSRAVGAAHKGGVATAFLVTAAISSFLSLWV